ncbi:hypothetical protein Acsp06_42670 [Actinomycetospora sp. NBRC 106375]|nr:hypothetical protein Acsp06_42670 [Actinomycetospora sp. NBRC 106375]
MPNEHEKALVDVVVHMKRHLVARRGLARDDCQRAGRASLPINSRPPAAGNVSPVPARTH